MLDIDIEFINKAYLFALDKHKHQKYGDKPFIYHLEQTYQILTTLLSNDISLRASGFLHDLIEDTDVTYDEIKEQFGEDVAELVKEATSSGRNRFPDLRTIRGVILLTASRLANICNMDDWSEEKKHAYVFKKSKYWLA